VSAARVTGAERERARQASAIAREAIARVQNKEDGMAKGTSSTKVKVEAREVQVGDRVSQQKGQDARVVEQINDGEKARRIVFEGGASIRPRFETQVWREGSSDGDQPSGLRGKAAEEAANGKSLPEQVAEAKAEREAKERREQRKNSGKGGGKYAADHKVRVSNGIFRELQAQVGKPNGDSPEGARELAAAIKVVDSKAVRHRNLPLSDAAYEYLRDEVLPVAEGSLEQAVTQGEGAAAFTLKAIKGVRKQLA
jgi:hypothetical protein